MRSAHTSIHEPINSNASAQLGGSGPDVFRLGHLSFSVISVVINATTLPKLRMERFMSRICRLTEEMHT